MAENYLCVSIPAELQCYQKVSDLLENEEFTKVNSDFGVKFKKDINGNLQFAAYYTDTGELIKKIYYEGSSVSLIEHYRNNMIYSAEKYAEGRISRKIMYNSAQKVISEITYVYNNQGDIIAINKKTDEAYYIITYGYDELKRVNSRTISINKKELIKQQYKYDILDRVVEYTDLNQKIKVHKVNSNNQLICYTITDKAENNIIVTNKFMCSEYIGTEIDLNGHKTSISDMSYVDNVMLKKPYTSEDDLDFAITNVLKIKPPEEDLFNKTLRNNNQSDIMSFIIDNNITQSKKTLPISIRKQLLLKS